MEGEFPDGEITCEEPILVVSFKIGLCRVDPKGKECRTVFQRLSFNGKTSVVRCLPLTGRTHQIRVHLQFLGFPILNDPIYGSAAWGPHKGKGGLLGKSNEELLRALVEEHQSKESLHLLDIPDDFVGDIIEAGKHKTGEELDKSADSHPSDTDMKSDALVAAGGSSSCGTANETGDGNAVKTSESECTLLNTSNGNETDSSQQNTPGCEDHLCSECKLVRPDPTEKELIMYLHALRYKGPDFEYSTCLPDWAKEDWPEEG